MRRCQVGSCPFEAVTKIRGFRYCGRHVPIEIYKELHLGPDTCVDCGASIRDNKHHFRCNPCHATFWDNRKENYRRAHGQLIRRT